MSDEHKCERCNLTKELAGMIEICSVNPGDAPQQIISLVVCDLCLQSMIMWAQIPIKRVSNTHNQYLNEYGGKGF